MGALLAIITASLITCLLAAGAGCGGFKDAPPTANGGPPDGSLTGWIAKAARFAGGRPRQPFTATVQT